MNAIIRPAVPADLAAVSLLAGELVRMHHSLDAKRFLLVPNVEAGYEHFLGQELGSERALVLVAELAGKIVGYAYGRLERRDWNQLLDAHAALHDIYVDPAERRSGIARQLLLSVFERFAAKGAPRLVLHTATANLAAQRLFATVGFRHTMIEMTRELA